MCIKLIYLECEMVFLNLKWHPAATNLVSILQGIEDEILCGNLQLTIDVQCWETSYLLFDRKEHSTSAFFTTI